MSLGPVMLDIAGTSLTSADRALMREPAVGGVIRPGLVVELGGVA